VPPSSAAVRGRVIDVQSGRPVPGASVYLTQTGEVALADDAGLFELYSVEPGPRPKSVTLAVVDPSYQRADVKAQVPAKGAGAGRPVEIRLAPLTVRSEEIVVEVERERAVAGGTSVLREEITRVPGARGDLLTAIKSLPGIANTGTFGPNAGGIVIRGSAPGDSKVLVDGFEIPILYHFGGLQSVIPSELIDDISFMPGGFGTEYGRASGGVIQVGSRKAEATKLSGFGELSFINAAALVKGPITKDVSFVLAARRSIIDAIVPAFLPSDGSTSFTTVPRYYDYQARLDWKFRERQRLSMFLFGSDDAFEVITSELDAQDPLLTGNFKNRTTFTRAIFSHVYEAPGRYNRIALSPTISSLLFEIGNRQRYLDLSTFEVTARDDLRFRLGPKVNLIGGAEVQLFRRTANGVFIRPPREGQAEQPNFTTDAVLTLGDVYYNTNLALWGAAEVDPTPWLRATAGLRLDAFVRSSDVVPQPRAQLRFTLAPETYLRTSAGLYSRPPQNQDENTQSSLDPETAIQTAVGFERKLAPGLTAQATAFYTHRYDLIVLRGGRSDASTGSLDAAYINDGTGRTYGGELLVTARRDRYFGWLAYTLSRSQRRDRPEADERLFDFDQTHNLVALASVKFGRNRQWQVGGRFQLTTGRPYTPVTGAIFQSDQNIYRPIYGPVNSQRVAAQHQLDLRVDRVWTFPSWKLSAFVDISNVYYNAAVIDYSYSFDYSKRNEFKNLPILPSFGIRGER
jgi:hypothetical protein